MSYSIALVGVCISSVINILTYAIFGNINCVFYLEYEEFIFLFQTIIIMYLLYSTLKPLVFLNLKHKYYNHFNNKFYKLIMIPFLMALPLIILLIHIWAHFW
jgi:hypothetical protein